MNEQQIPEEVMYKIESEVKRIGKLSTAPDKETPDWMETDIRSGLKAGYGLARAELASKDAEIERLRGALQEIIHTTASKAYTPFQMVERCFKVADVTLSPSPVESSLTDHAFAIGTIGKPTTSVNTVPVEQEGKDQDELWLDAQRIAAHTKYKANTVASETAHWEVDIPEVFKTLKSKYSLHPKSI